MTSQHDYKTLPEPLRHHPDLIHWRIDHLEERHNELRNRVESKHDGMGVVEWTIAAVSIAASLRPDYFNALLGLVGL